MKKKWIIFFIVLGLITVTLSTFHPVLKSDFVNWDDQEFLQNNPLITSLGPGNLLKIFETPVIRVYCPLTVISFALEYHFWGLNPFIYHLDNLILHIGVICLIFWLGLQMGLTLLSSFFAALLFAIHPMHVESVAWVTERKDVLYAFFYLLSLNFYFFYLNEKKRGTFLIVLVLGLLSMLSKPMALSLPLILLLYDWFTERKIDRHVLMEKIWFFILIFPPVFLTAQNFLFSSDGMTVTGETSKLTWIFIFYLRKFFFPISLGLFYYLPEPLLFSNPSYALSFLAVLVLVLLMVFFRKNKLFMFANFFYIFSIFFVLRRMFIDSPGGNPYLYFNDRFMYLPSLGYCFWIGSLFSQFLLYFRSKKDARTVLAWLLLGFFFIGVSFSAYLSCLKWKNSLTLWSYSIKHSPQAAVAYNNRGTAQKNHNLALRDFTQCINLDPCFIEAYFNRAGIYLKKGAYDKAISDYSQCVKLDPADAISYYNLFKAYYLKGDFNKARENLLKSRSLGYRGN